MATAPRSPVWLDLSNSRTASIAWCSSPHRAPRQRVASPPLRYLRRIHPTHPGGLQPGTLLWARWRRSRNYTRDPNGNRVCRTGSIRHLSLYGPVHTPDILAVEELQNLPTLQSLATKINSDSVNAGQPNPNYQAYLSLGNDISGINSGFLLKTPKVSVTSVLQYGKDTTYTTPAGTQATLNDRPPLVLNATVLREGSDTALPIIVIVNHLRSLLSLDDPGSGPTVRAKRELRQNTWPASSRDSKPPTQAPISCRWVTTTPISSAMATWTRSASSKERRRCRVR